MIFAIIGSTIKAKNVAHSKQQLSLISLCKLAAVIYLFNLFTPQRAEQLIQ